MVFQSFALLPWLTVLQNVEIGLGAWVRTDQGASADARDRLSPHDHLLFG
jgi:ABC-type proline/glycine betaine transport system ATPase subunit